MKGQAAQGNGQPLPSKTLNSGGERVSYKEGLLARIKGRKELAAYLEMDDRGHGLPRTRLGLWSAKGRQWGGCGQSRLSFGTRQPEGGGVSST